MGFVGRLNWAKDLGTMVDAFARVHAQRKDVALVLAGEGSERGAVEAAIAQAAPQRGARNAQGLGRFGQAPTVGLKGPDNGILLSLSQCRGAFAAGDEDRLADVEVADPEIAVRKKGEDVRIVGGGPGTERRDVTHEADPLRRRPLRLQIQIDELAFQKAEAEYKRALVGELVQRAVRRAGARARGEF